MESRKHFVATPCSGCSLTSAREVGGNAVAEAGWYADPLGRAPLRHWNGESWRPVVKRDGAILPDSLFGVNIDELGAPGETVVVAHAEAHVEPSLAQEVVEPSIVEDTQFETSDASWLRPAAPQANDLFAPSSPRRDRSSGVSPIAQPPARAWLRGSISTPPDNTDSSTTPERETSEAAAQVDAWQVEQSDQPRVTSRNVSAKASLFGRASSPVGDNASMFAPASTETYDDIWALPYATPDDDDQKRKSRKERKKEKLAAKAAAETRNNAVSALPQWGVVAPVEEIEAVPAPQVEATHVEAEEITTRDSELAPLIDDVDSDHFAMSQASTSAINFVPVPDVHMPVIEETLVIITPSQVNLSYAPNDEPSVSHDEILASSPTMQAIQSDKMTHRVEIAGLVAGLVGVILIIVLAFT